jgi:hypothetical protein
MCAIRARKRACCASTWAPMFEPASPAMSQYVFTDLPHKSQPARATMAAAPTVNRKNAAAG